MYYCASNYGSYTAAIGLATSTTGEPDDWTDHGLVIDSALNTTTPYHAIDANLLVDGDIWYLTFGSFGGGIFQTQLDPTTGKLKNPSNPSENEFVLLAARPNVLDGPVEGGYLFKKGIYRDLLV